MICQDLFRVLRNQETYSLGSSSILAQNDDVCENCTLHMVALPIKNTNLVSGINS